MASISLQTPVMGPSSKEEIAAAKADARKRGALQPFTDQYLDQMGADAIATGVSFRVMYGQFADETGDGDGHVGVSELYEETGNPVGLGKFDDGTYVGGNYTPITAAHSQIVHALVYAQGRISPASPAYGWIKYDPRYQALLDAGYGGVVRVVADYGNGHHATNPNYGPQIVARANAAFSGVGTAEEEPDPMATKPTIFLTAGHRSDNDTGNPDEKNRTQFLAHSYQAAFKAAGFVVHYLQNEDGDNREDITTGGLDTVSAKMRNLMLSVPGPGVDLDLHYEGASARGVFAIVPDETGLTTAIAGGAPGNDTWANNPLDVQLARSISSRISKATGLPLRATTEPGVMSERATGVGGQGYRLATMAYSVPVRDRVVRLVVEHGSLPTADRDIILQDDFTDKCAAAAVQAVMETFGIDQAQPEPPAPSKYGKPGWKPAEDGKDHRDAKGNLFRAVNRLVFVEGGTQFFSQASTSSKETRSPAPPDGMWVRIAWQMNSFYVTPVGSRFKINQSNLKVSFKDQ